MLNHPDYIFKKSSKESGKAPTSSTVYQLLQKPNPLKSEKSPIRVKLYHVLPGGPWLYHSWGSSQGYLTPIYTV